MKILYVDAFKARHAQTNIQGLKRAFQKFAIVETFDYRTLAQISSKEKMNKALFKFVLAFKPDLIFLGKCESVFGSTLKDIKNILDVFVVSFLGDFYWEPCPFKVDQGHYADLNLFSYYEESIMNAYKNQGVDNIGYWIDGFDETVSFNMEFEKTKDVIFLGSNHAKINNYLEGYKFRENLIKEIDGKFNIELYGKGWSGFNNHYSWVNQEEKTRVVNIAKINLDIPAVVARLYLSFPRVFQTLPCNILYLTQYVPDLELLFKVGKHIEWYKTQEECLDKINYYLIHDNERKQIAQNAMEYVKENHTYTNRVQGILDCKVKNGNNIYSYLGMSCTLI